MKENSSGAADERGIDACKFPAQTPLMAKKSAVNNWRTSANRPAIFQYE
jgi:hypothetical protein